VADPLRRDIEAIGVDMPDRLLAVVSYDS